jgi:hypothetical protein
MNRTASPTTTERSLLRVLSSTGLALVALLGFLDASSSVAHASCVASGKALASKLPVRPMIGQAMGANVCRAQEHKPVMAVNGSMVSGHATLVVDHNGTHALLHVKNLMPGVAYTVWFDYDDDTSKCMTPHQCGGPDDVLPHDNPTGVFGRMDSAVAGDDGELTFQATLRDFKVSPGSAVTLALFSHGPASTDNKQRARQLLTPQVPGLGAPGLGTSADGQKGFPAALAVFDIPVCK